jgi:hypothetical protein
MYLIILTIAYFVSYVFGSPVQWPVHFASWQAQIHWCWSFWQAGPQKLFPGLQTLSYTSVSRDITTIGNQIHKAPIFLSMCSKLLTKYCILYKACKASFPEFFNPHPSQFSCVLCSVLHGLSQRPVIWTCIMPFKHCFLSITCHVKWWKLHLQGFYRTPNRNFSRVR